jgi:hypothetical protein
MRTLLALAMGVGCLASAFRAAPAADPMRLRPVNLGNVNTAKDEDDPYLAADRLRLFYASNAGGRFRIMRSQRSRLNQLWPAGQGIEGLGADEESDRRSPFLAKGGQFYFASNAVPRDPDKKFVANFDLYHSVNTGGASFTMPTPVSGVCTGADELHPWVTPSGREFYFSRKDKDGWHVYVARGPRLGAITKPRPVNLPAGFHHPTLSPNGLTMYVQGPLPRGRWGLFRTTRPRLGAAWGKPVELTALNSPEAPRGDLSPGLSPDGRKLYFASDRPGGKGGLDLWVIPVASLKKGK